jgi:hypothetical protein
MQHYGEEHSPNVPMNDEQIAESMIANIAGFSILSMTSENEKLTTDLALVDDAIRSRGIDNWMSVYSVTNILTDKNEVDKFINGVPQTSRFYKSYPAVQRLVECLYYWMNEGLFFSQDSMVKAFNALADRLADNIFMMESSSPHKP